MLCTKKEGPTYRRPSMGGKHSYPRWTGDNCGINAWSLTHGSDFPIWEVYTGKAAASRGDMNDSYNDVPQNVRYTCFPRAMPFLATFGTPAFNTALLDPYWKSCHILQIALPCLPAEILCGYLHQVLPLFLLLSVTLLEGSSLFRKAWWPMTCDYNVSQVWERSVQSKKLKWQPSYKTNRWEEVKQVSL